MSLGEGGAIDFETALVNIIEGSTLVFTGLTEEELDEFAAYCKDRSETIIEAGKDSEGRTHVRKHR